MRIFKTLKLTILLYICYLFLNELGDGTYNYTSYVVNLVMKLEIPIYLYTLIHFVEVLYSWWKGK